MAFNRRHVLMLGVVVFAIGLQFRIFDSVVLNESSSRFIAEKLKRPEPGTQTVNNVLATSVPIPVDKRTIKPPTWIGWAIISVGAVLVLHSLAMSGPD